MFQFSSKPKANTAAYIAILLVPVLFSGLYLKSFAVNSIHEDDFDMVPMILSENMDLGDYWAPHTTHIMFFSRILYTLIAQQTNLNIIYILCFIMLLYNILYISFVSWYRKNINMPYGVLFPLAVGIFLFNPMQFGIFLWAAAINLTLCLFFTCFSLYFFQHMFLHMNRSPASAVKYLVLSVLCGAIGTFSLSQALTVWPTVLLVWVMHERRAAFKNPLFYAWAAAAAACFVTYKVFTASSEGMLSRLAQNPVGVFLYFLTYLGNYTHYMAFGFLVLCLSLAVLFDFLRRNRPEDLLSVSLVVNFTAVAALTAVTRIDLGIGQANSSRYVGFSLPVLLGCFAYMCDNASTFLNRSWRSGFTYSAITRAVLITVVAASFGVGLHKSSTFSAVAERNKYYMETFETQPDRMLENFFVDRAAAARAYCESLKDRSLLVFHGYRDRLAETAGMAVTPLENHRDFVVLDGFDFYDFSGDPYILISGAAIDPGRQGPAESVFVVFDDLRFLADYGFYDQSVRKISRRSRFRLSGFSRAVPLRLLPEGEYDVRIQMLNRDRDVLYETGSLFTLSVSPGRIDLVKSYSPAGR